MSTLLEFSTRIVTVPIVLIAWTVLQFLAAIYLGEVAPARWKHVAIWLPVVMLTIVALRPYPAAQSAPPTIAVETVSVASERAYALDGSIHRSGCERLRGREAIPVRSVSSGIQAGLSECPDCLGQHFLGAE